MEYTYTIGSLPKEEVAYYEEMNRAWKCTGETLREEYTNNYGLVTGMTYVVMTGDFTAFGMCRDCGDHYIIARWSRYDRIDKKTLTITYDVKDI